MKQNGNKVGEVGMTDKKQVMFDIERCICHVPDACRDCSKYKGVDGLRCMEELMADAYTLLKEQETSNLYKCPNCGTWVSAENVVRCKDCAKRYTRFCPDVDSPTRADDWYCADGERK